MPSVSTSAISQPRTAHQNSSTMSGRTASIAKAAMRLVMSPILAASQFASPPGEPACAHTRRHRQS